MNTRVAAIDELERRLGHRFADRELLERALTHSSVGARAPGLQNNERLEFLGDRVLNLIVAEELMARAPLTNEGELTKAFHKLVNVEACAEAGRRMGLSDALRFGGGAGKLGMRENARIVGDACEALIAALYLDAGFAFTRDCVLRFWSETLDGLDTSGHRDPKTRLNEWAMARGAPPPVYRVLKQEGPPHAPTFEIEVFVQGVTPETAQGGSKREAEKLAAQQMLDRQAADQEPDTP
jgi:ribonuclease-3